MPDLDGAQVGRAIRALRRDLPLLLVSGFGADLAAEHLAALEPCAFLRKPYRPEQLAAELERLLARAAAADRRAGPSTGGLA